MELPIGEYFEIFVRGLKSQFGAFFEAVSEAIDVAITVIEKVLSIDTGAWYPIVVVCLLTGFLVYVITSKKTTKRIGWIAGIVTVVVLAGVEKWRLETLDGTVNSEQAQEMLLELNDYRESLSQEPDEEMVESATRVIDRIIFRFESVEETEKRVDLLGSRTYERMREYLAAIADGDSVDESLQQKRKNLRKALSPYDPDQLSWYPWLISSIWLTLLAWVCAGTGLAIFTVIGFSLIMMMGFWSYTVETLALVLSATGFALLLGVPLGVAAAANKTVDQISKPILDFMQTMPAFVYLIPAVLLFGLGKVPGAMATLIFAMPPAVRLTSLGIRSVPTEVVEAAQSFGSTPMQLLFKAQLPIALPTILAGLNQTIMLALSMVVIGGMIGAGGLGEVVLSGITQLKIGLGFESGLSVVILAIYLDRLTQALGGGKKTSTH